MFRKTVFAALLIFTVILPAFAQEAVWSVPKKGKPPVIVIPGIMGSELVNSKTGELVWFDVGRSKEDDLKLPISADIAANRDDLVPRDILRSIKILNILPDAEVYQALTAALEKEGYAEGKWDAPAETGFQDSFYVFAYDWRRDNIENARILIRRIESLKAKLGKPDLKFNIVGHSMGGLIARYAARFGDADVPASGAIRPTWAGARHIGKIFLVGTPNEGSTSALDVLVNGISLAPKGINLPFIRSLTKYDIFSIPSVYQLLPHSGTARVYDENGKRIQVNLFDRLTWEKYGWAAYQENGFNKKFSDTEQKQAKEFLSAVLKRAARFHEAIDTGMNTRPPVGLYLIGSGCRKTLEGVILRQGDRGAWQSIFGPESFKRSDGTRVTEAEVREMLFTDGDGTVTKDSLLTASFPMAVRRKDGNRTRLAVEDIFFTCEAHQKLTGNPEVQKKLFEALAK
jgi:pimeloyl-ACP methyl ester carboxylesterase